MADVEDLPEDVVAALRAGQKIEAIKLLCEQRGIGLKEAKEAVEGWSARDPATSLRPPTTEGFGVGQLLLVAVLSALGYAVYRLLT